ncbi:circadian locomoter output cycles protein kaput [Schistocerca gregaria]|uniref:circadian locomoter output cycles protein kaput n=1 Tax=Schistocerca gregaria TaxID=7010 RepID=UPI00211F3C6F|nr:circadian locomoter output cycles protein kaput [Schistocerca gregaria]
MSQLGTVYATKRRRRNGKSLKPPPKDGVTKSNPSKRHRERLNAELDTLASLLPFEQNILSKLDRLSILRLSVSYLRTKSYFQVVMHKDKEDSQYRNRDLTAYDHSPLDGDMFLQALNGFLLILTCEGEVFFATHSIESYLGFHQSDIVHQSVYELVHSEDREELQRQLMWNSFLPPESASMALQDALAADNCHLLERSFTVRFRCLLDNTSGFLRLDIRGRVKVLHGQNRKTEEPPLALFAICTPFGPPSLLEIPHKEVMFKSKHKLDLALVSMDQRGKMLLGYSDAELANLGGYDLVHYDDLAYVASAHQELLKTGASGMIAYRFQTKEGQWQWLQTSSRLVYKNSKPDFVISTHRPLMEEEGRDLLGKRTMDFKVSYLDAGLTNSYFADADQLVVTSGVSTPQHAGSPSATSTTPQRVNRRYKTQLRDFLSTCRTKRKLSAAAAAAAAVSTSAAQLPAAAPAIEYVDTSSAAAAAVAAAYSNLNNMYAAPYQAASGGDASLGPYMGHSNSNFHQSLYSSTALDNRFLATDNLFHQYRPLGTYYPEYHPAATTPYVGNGFLEMSTRPAACSLPAYDHHHHHHHHLAKDDKLYACQQLADRGGGGGGGGGAAYTKCLDAASYAASPLAVELQTGKPPANSAGAQPTPAGDAKASPVSSSNSAGSSPATDGAVLVTPKMEELKADVLAHQQHHQAAPPPPPPPQPPAQQQQPQHYGERQTVLMWGSAATSAPSTPSPPTPAPQAAGNGATPYRTAAPPPPPPAQSDKATHPLKSLAEMNSVGGGGGSSCKWGSVAKPEPVSPPIKYPSQHPQHQAYSEAGAATEVWPAHQYHQYYPYTTPYHHHAPHTSVNDSGYPQINRTGVLCCQSLR